MTDTGTAAVERPAYLIRKYGAYYKPDSRGYTGCTILAGRYTLAEAESITHPNGKGGPRDGMTYIHETELADPSWLAYAAIAAERDAALLAVKRLRAALEPFAVAMKSARGRMGEMPADRADVTAIACRFITYDHLKDALSEFAQTDASP